MRGSQEPRVKVEPHRIGSHGEDAALLMKEYGVELDEWQKIVIDCWLGYDESGKYNVTSAGLSVPRQNGKNVDLEAREFFGLVVLGEKILHTAHQVRTSKKSFRRLAAMFTDKKHPEVTDAVKQIRYTNGEECIELVNGGTIEFSARSRQAARGFDGISLVVFDEAQELTDDQVEAIMATLSASATGNRQIIYTGTPPYPGCPGEVFRRRRKASIEEPGKHDAWHEWGVEARTIADIKVDDVSLWYMANPALGIRLDEEFTAEEMRSMSPDGFARERLGWWAPIIEHEMEYLLDAETWDALASMELKPNGKTAYGVKFTDNGVALCGAVIPNEGKARISLIEYRDLSMGTTWLAEWLNQRYREACCVVIDGRNGVDVLIDRICDIWRVKGSVIRVSVKDYVASIDTLMDGIREESITWYKPQEALRESALSCVERRIGGAMGIGGEFSAPLEACALALWGAKTSKRNPERVMRIG